MATPFLSSEEYDDRAHRYYDDGSYDAALETLKEGLRLYPHSVELYVGLGYTRLAREEYVWARQAFERALVLDPEHEDGLVGMGESLLRFGQKEDALRLFARARETACGEDLELLLTMGRALYRERMYIEAREVFAEAVELHSNSAEAAAAYGYTLHRLDEETAARRQLRRALHLDSEYHEARIYLGHLLYDRGDWVGAARELERVAPSEHWDTLAIWRLIELKRALEGLEPGAPELSVWERRLEEVEEQEDPIEELLAEVEAGVNARESEAEPVAVVSMEDAEAHRVHLPDGFVVAGTWRDIVEQLRQARSPGETIAQFMRRTADEAQERAGVTVPAEDPRSIVLAGARAGFWQISIEAMIETDRVLRPLKEAEPAIERLDTYESPAVLTEALRATWHAVDRTLRTLLRSDASAPDSIRLTAMSPEQMSADTVLTELRRRELITLGLAGRVHELRQAVERAERGEVRASDADNARDVVRCAIDEVNRLARRPRASGAPTASAASSAAGASSAEVLSVSDDEVWLGSASSAPTAAHVAEALRDTSRFQAGSRAVWIAAAAAGLLVIAVVAVLLLGRDSELEKGVAAFREDRGGVAEQHFRAALEEDDGNNTARLYLARILREQGRNEEAADMLRTAASLDGQDAAVRRELGYLFLDLDVAKPAVQQFRRAVEIDPAEPLNWVGLYEALVRDGDAAGAAETLRRAPAEAQTMVRQRTGG